MIEKDPLIRAIVDPAHRNLLDPENLDLFEVDISRGGEVKFQLQVENGPEAPIDVEISCDQPWLEPETRLLKLVGGESGQCFFKAKPTGDTEFANVLFSWDGQKRKHQQSVMIRRVLPVAPPVPTGSIVVLAIVAIAIGLIIIGVGAASQNSAMFAFFGIVTILLGLGGAATWWLSAKSSAT